MKKAASITISLLLLVFGCTHRHVKLLQQGMLQQGIDRQAFVEAWGLPEHTKVITSKDAEETLSFSLSRMGGGLFKGKRTFSVQLWDYERYGVKLLFDGSHLIDWRTDKTTQELQMITDQHIRP